MTTKTELGFELAGVDETFAVAPVLAAVVLFEVRDAEAAPAEFSFVLALPCTVSTF